MIRKSLKKNILLMASAMVIPFMIAGTCSINSQACEMEIVEVDKEAFVERGVERSPIMYRRLYNYSDGYWIGDWELVPLKEV